jgi:hypothetical protein
MSDVNGDDVIEIKLYTSYFVFGMIVDQRVPVFERGVRAWCSSVVFECFVMFNDIRSKEIFVIIFAVFEGYDQNYSRTRE